MQAIEQLVCAAQWREVRAVQIAISLFLLCFERSELFARDGAPKDLREDVLVLQAVDRLQERVVEREAAFRSELAPRIEMETQVVDQRAIQIEDRASTQDGDTRP